MILNMVSFTGFIHLIQNKRIKGKMLNNLSLQDLVKGIKYNLPTIKINHNSNLNLQYYLGGTKDE